MAKKPTPRKQAPSFEEALSSLEALVESMENDQLALEDLVSHYEQGATLLQHCEKVLETARKRIELIEISPSAENGLESTPSADDDSRTGAGSSDGEEDDDIQLL